MYRENKAQKHQKKKKVTEEKKKRERRRGIYLILIHSIILHLHAWLPLTIQGCAETLLKNFYMPFILIRIKVHLHTNSIFLWGENYLIKLYYKHMKVNKPNLKH